MTDEATASETVPSGFGRSGYLGADRGLSRRESEVLMLVSDGLTNAEIADALYISLETVKSHVSTVIAKLEVRNRVQAATYVVRREGEGTEGHGGSLGPLDEASPCVADHRGGKDERDAANEDQTEGEDPTEVDDERP